MKDGVLTFDVGTTGLKSSFFDESGAEVAVVVEPYPTSFPRPGWAEQDACEYWRAAAAACRRLFSSPGIDPGSVAAIGLSGHMNGCLPVGRDGEPLRPELIHSDTRGTAQARKALERLPLRDFYALTGNRLDARFSLPKMLWVMDEEPEIYSATAYFLNSKDYLRSKLTGEVGLTDLSDASLTCCLDLGAKAWSREIAEATGLDLSKLPRTAPGEAIAGSLSREAAASLGLREGLPVGVGGGDAACATRGACSKEISGAYIALGSSAWTSTLSETPCLDPMMRVQNFFDLDGRRCNICGTAQNASVAADWALRTLGEAGADFARLEAAAASSPPGSRGLLFLPYLMGERTPHWNADARGAFLGLSLGTKKEDMLRSVLEGVAFTLGDLLAVQRELGFAISSLALLGGGARSGLWSRIICDALDLPLVLHPSPLSATSLGAAMAAGQAVGLYRPGFVPAAADGGRRLEPEPEAAARYASLRKLFDEAYAKVEPTCEALSVRARAESEDEAGRPRV
jgi:xylulokinase